MAWPSLADRRGLITRRHSVPRTASKIRVRFLQTGTSGTQLSPLSTTQPVQTEALPSEQSLLVTRCRATELNSPSLPHDSYDGYAAHAPHDQVCLCGRVPSRFQLSGALSRGGSGVGWEGNGGGARGSPDLAGNRIFCVRKKIRIRVMDWRERVVFPVRRAWAGVAARLRASRKRGTGILKLHDDVQTCGYRDVEVMWEMLRSEMELTGHATAGRRRSPWWVLFWSGPGRAAGVSQLRH
ncbi:hypothetical protein Taro_041712 [Colocasia esculenta]|uniref:Uncharacterized protein n=1 Tax=Colocasia esculenta TaxID=4460 RepID=A0A843WF24_COLES|nr:hypothetical protein [Colocasia esculenta]